MRDWGKRPPLPWGSFGRALKYYSTGKEDEERVMGE
jgi:hypothetical protein